jgi:hypothetical protein
VAPDGRIFGIADRTMYYINWGGNGSYTAAGTMPANGPSGVTSSEVMYAPGKILRVGGGAAGSSEGGNGKGAASIIDIGSGATVVKPIDALPGGVGFHWLTATVVADGRVVVTGGSPLNNQTSAGWNKRAYIWNPHGPPQDPGRGAWTEGAFHDQAPARLYHSIALLLPDATLLVGGGGAPGPQTNLNAEVYYPPYLFDASGQFAGRPTISKAPASVVIGQPFSLTMSNTNPVKRVTLIKTGSVTHSFNMDQRFQELSFVQNAKVLTVQGPLNANVAPPGMYLVFAINAQGVPSIARIVKFRRS